MNKFTNPLDNIKVASPCSQDWNAMLGDERKRFCGSCNLNVYNLSGMTKDEAEKLILNSEGRLCVRFFKRADGTVLTKDCPVGLVAFKKRISRFAAATASLAFGILGGLGMNSFFNNKENTAIMGDIAPISKPIQISKPTPKPIQNDEIEIMGGITELVKETQKDVVIGQISFPKKGKNN